MSSSNEGSVVAAMVLTAIMVGAPVSIGQALRAKRELRRALVAQAQAQAEKADALIEKSNPGPHSTS